MTNSELIGLIGLLIGLTSFVGGGILWYKGSVEKRYAAERDFRHLQRNYEQLAHSILELDKDFDELKRSASVEVEELRKLNNLYGDLMRNYLEQKTFIGAISNQLNILSARLDNSTGGWSRRSE